MNGQYSIKGYLIQSFVALLDSFEQDWETVCVEPNDESEKVDIKWTYRDSSKKVVQVKSSKNTFTLSAVKKWAKDLAQNSPNAIEYELILVGYVDKNIKNLPNNQIDNVTIVIKDLTIEDFETILIGKINCFFEKQGKNTISHRLGKLFALALNQQILQNSVIGKIVERKQFELSLLDSLEAIEKHLKHSAYNLLIPDKPSCDESVKETIMNHILKLIGWDSMNRNEEVTLYDEKLGNDIICKIDYWGDYDCPLKDGMKDVVYIHSSVDARYPVNYRENTKVDLFHLETVRNKLIRQSKIDVNRTMEYCVNFVLSLNESEQGESIYGQNEAYKGTVLNKDLIYCVIDNPKADFLISSIITARKYRDTLLPKFLYPITDDNSQTEKIGNRSAYMPPQYINSSILPIIKEDENKISVLLFCSDSFRKDRLKKVLWLLIRLTSGLANEYIIYFTDFDERYRNDVNEAIRSYGNTELTRKVRIEKLQLCNSSNLLIVPPDLDEELVDDEFDESRNIKKRLKIEPHLIEYLPYGDSIKPFLASEAVKAEDLKVFLQNKGIYFKTADKTKIIRLMTSMLFSPLDIDALVDYVNVNQKPFNTSSAKFALIDEDKTVNDLKNKFTLERSVLQDGLKADIVDIESQYSLEENGIYSIKLYLEQKNPNKQALVSIVRSTAQVNIKKDSATKSIEFEKEYNSTVARVAAERIVKQISNKLIHSNDIEEKTIEVHFSDFTNRERINFFLSFTNIESSSIFTRFDAKSLKYMFDEKATLPDEFKDKEGKECVTQLKGKDLDSIKEFQDEVIKEIILGEEMAINYRYTIRGISGNFFVVMSFSNALKNVPVKDGIFNYKFKVYIDSKDKEKVSNIHKLELELKKEFNRLKKEKLQLINMI